MPLTTDDPIEYALTAADTSRMLSIPLYTIGLALEDTVGIRLLKNIPWGKAATIAGTAFIIRFILLPLLLSLF